MHLLFILPLTASAFSTRSSLLRTFVTKQTLDQTSTSFLLTHHRHYYRHPSQTQHLRGIIAIHESESGENEISRNSMRVLGVCGGIGSGKSTACQLMVDSLGCVARIDADKLAHVVYEPGSKALDEISKEFGKDILDDADNTQIDRKKLGAIVFNDAASMSKLEHIVWPHVRDKIEEQIDDIIHKHQAQSTTTSKQNIIIVEAALLLETNWHDLLDGLWVIQSSESVAIQRLKDNRGLTEEESLVRINAQNKRRGIGSANSDGAMSDELRREIEDGTVTAVITNDGSMEDLEKALGKALGDPASFSK